MSENFRSEQPVELSFKMQWGGRLMLASILPICFLLLTYTDSNFNQFGIDEIILISVAIFTVVALSILLLCRKIIKRFSIDSSRQSLVFEVFLSGIRVIKRSYPFETINKFDLIIRNMRRGSDMYSSIQEVKILALVLQSGKIKYFTGYLHQDNAKIWAMQLNKLLQDQGGFPAERFAEPLTPHWPEGDQNLS